MNALRSFMLVLRYFRAKIQALRCEYCITRERGAWLCVDHRKACRPEVVEMMDHRYTTEAPK